MMNARPLPPSAVRMARQPAGGLQLVLGAIEVARGERREAGPGRALTGESTELLGGV